MTRFWTSLAIWTAAFLLSHLFGGSSNPAATASTASEYAYRYSTPAAQDGFSMASLVVPVWLYVIGAVAIYITTGFNIVNQWEKRIITRFGNIYKVLNGGLGWVDPAFCKILDDIDLRQTVQTLQVPTVQTKNNVPVKFNLVITKLVANVNDYVLKVANGLDATNLRALAMVTEIVRKTDLDTILHSPDTVYAQIMSALGPKVQEWGIQIVAVEIKDFEITDQQIAQAIAMKARAEKEAEAELKRAEMQKRVATELSAAAKALSDEAWRLKGLETLVELTRSASNNTILIPTDLIHLADIIPDHLKKAALGKAV